jgi:hypothetical protein
MSSLQSGRIAIHTSLAPKQSRECHNTDSIRRNVDRDRLRASRGFLYRNLNTQ